MKNVKDGGFFRNLFMLCATGSGLAILLAGLVYWQFARGLPQIIAIGDYHPALVTQVIATGPPAHPEPNPVVIAEFKKERRYLLPADKIPEVAIRAFVAAEDDKFFEHPGINIAGMIRAALANLRAGRTVQGGSTITQQVTKSLILSSEKTFTRKIKEIILAQRLERNLTKHQILYLYLNEIYLGHGSYGIEAASRTYFRKSASQLTLAEAALLAGMPQAPGKYSPLLNPKRAKERQIYVLHRMKETGAITEVAMNVALAEPIRVYEADDINAKYAPYLVEYVRQHLADRFGEKALYEGGLTVQVPTTAALSLAANKSVRDGLEAVDKRGGYRGPIKRLKPEEINAYLDDERTKQILKKLESRMLTPEGKLDLPGVMKAAGVSSDDQLIDVGADYEALVTDVNDQKKTVSIQVGHVMGVIPLGQMKWARQARELRNPPSLGPEPRVPSAVLKRGDVILAKVLSIKNGTIQAALDQEPQVEGAILSLETQTGYVLAMSGGYDFSRSEFNRAIQALRQPGSAFKPILYSAALERGFTPASVIVDSPVVYSDAEQGKWKPANFEEKFYGDTTFRQALIHSRNVPTIKILQQVQIPYFIDYAKRLGISAQLPADLSISLGSASLSLLELTKAYSIFVRQGRKIEPIFMTKVTDSSGAVLEENQPKAVPSVTPQPSSSPSLAAPSGTTAAGYPPPDDPDLVLDPRIAYVMSHLMKEVVAFGTGQEAQQLGRPAAGKTGTTSEYVDAWFMGFTPYVVTGTWVGYDNHRQIGPLETGARAALPIWLSFMHDAVQSYPPDDFAIPPGIVFASIDQTTGKLAPPNALRAIKEAFIEGTEPKEAASDGSTQESPRSSGSFFKEDPE